MTKKALTLALEALEKERPYLGAMPALTSKAITAIKEALSELEQDDEVLGFNGWGFPIEKPSQPEQEPVEDLQAKLKWATEQLEANINWEFVAAAKEEMLKAAWAEIKELREQIKEPEQERCVGCEACIDTACGRDECPKGWPKAAQPEQEPVAYCNGMPAYEGPLSKTQRKEPEQEPVATLDDLEQEIYENTRQFVSRDVMEWMLKRYYTTPPQRKPLTDEEIGAILEGVNAYGTRLYTFARAIEAAHGIKE